MIVQTPRSRQTSQQTPNSTTPLPMTRASTYSQPTHHTSQVHIAAQGLVRARSYPPYNSQHLKHTNYRYISHY